MNRAALIAEEDLLQLRTYRKLPIVAESASGSWITDVDGRRYLDFYGGHCVALLGHCPPRVVDAIRDQAGKLIFYSNLVYSPIRAEAARRLMDLAPAGMQGVFFCNSGTEANETALKLARKATGRSRVIAMEGDFHGRTLGSLATTWSKKYRDGYQEVMPGTTFVPFAHEGALESAFSEGESVAAVIIEPIQSMQGVRTAPAAYFRRMRDLCDQHGAMLIFDEVQTGIGRTGTFSISEAYGMTPDLITLAKSLGSGVPVGAVLANERIASSVEFGDQGTTFGGGMLAMAAVAATLQSLVEENLMSRAPEIFDRISEGVQGRVVEVRGAGCLIGLDLGIPVQPVVAALREEGVLVGGSDDPTVMRLMPPITVTNDEIDQFTAAYIAAVSRTS